ncbi:hypothetical protein BVH03_06650 [Pseudomonas sp. PA15(2017)]|uniref:hypothetical protein n=1 Tax=Pseudomonas sp. PA15(2017) TaxID=1932111 RepID=UPI0009610135|nr:hypothetical protein [Pseudomonas sp. PA15(2017)]OLU32639.1 hypothetical protein BVH03_06650 [Pseudomonas sp. PA15(2017)]
MDNDSKDRPHKRPAKIISGHWQHDAQEQLRARIQAEQSHTDELEALANIARSTIADLENPDAVVSPDRLREATRQLAALRDTLNNYSGHAVHSVDRFAREHPLWLAAGGLAVGVLVSRVLRKRRSRADDYSHGGTLR